MYEDLGWVDEFYAAVRDYILVRKEDRVLILPPNRVYKLNETAFRVLDYLRQGKKLMQFPGLDSRKAGDILAFFRDLKRIYEGEEVALERVPYDFDFTRLPVLGEIAVTYRCNNRCSFCYAGCGGGEGSCASPPNDGREMSLPEIKKVIGIFKEKAQIPFFSFTGGEPLLRGDLEEMAAYAVRLGLRVNLITNGTLATEERARFLFQSGLRTAQVSLESPEASVHDELAGREGSFEQTLKGIQNLMAAGFSVQTNTTVTRKNRDGLLSMPAFLAGLGIARFSMNLFIPTGSGLHHEELLVRYREIGSFIDSVRREAYRAGLTFYWYSPTPFCHYNPIARGLGNKSCAAMDGLISVTPSGEVIPCSSYNEAMGSLLSDEFMSLWFSQRARFFKEKRYAPEACSGCDVFVSCQAACPLYWQFAGTDEISPIHAKRGEGMRSPALSV